MQDTSILSFVVPEIAIGNVERAIVVCNDYSSPLSHAVVKGGASNVD